MARFTRIDSQIRANRVIFAHRFRVPELNPFFANSRGGWELRITGLRRFARIARTLCFFLRIDSRESPRFALRIAGPSKLGHVILGLARYIGCERRRCKYDLELCNFIKLHVRPGCISLGFRISCVITSRPAWCYAQTPFLTWQKIPHWHCRYRCLN